MQVVRGRAGEMSVRSRREEMGGGAKWVPAAAAGGTTFLG